MSRFDASKDYYTTLGASPGASPGEIERLYKHQARRHHPDRGGDEEEMKALNEAYAVLHDEATRRAYDSEREVKTRRLTVDEARPPYSSPSARADWISGQLVGALLCLFAGIVLLLLVRFQWMWFLFPLAVLAVLLACAGVLMLRSVLVYLRGTLARTHPAQRFTMVQEALFWSIVCGGGYGIYLVLSAV